MKLDKWFKVVIGNIYMHWKVAGLKQLGYCFLISTNFQHLKTTFNYILRLLLFSFIVNKWSNICRCPPSVFYMIPFNAPELDFTTLYLYSISIGFPYTILVLQL